MAFAPTPGGTRGWEEGRRLCGAKPGQGPRPHAALHGARFANGILWVCTELLWFPPSPRTGGLTPCPGPCHPLTSVSVVPMVTAWTCSRLHPDPQHNKSPPVPIRSPSPRHLPGGSSASGSFWNEEKVLVWGLVAPLSWVSVPISSTADVCPWLGRAQGGSLQSPEMVPSRGHGHLTPLHPSVSRGAKSPASGTFLLSWDQPHPHQQEPSRGFQGAWGQPPEPAGTAGTLWARHKQCRIHSVTPGHAQRTGCLAKGAAAAGVGAGRSCSAPRCPHFPAPQCPDRCLARQGTPARWGRGPVVVGRAPCSPWVPSSVEVSAKQAQRWLGSVRFSCRGLINS